jgi:hypothetical protein
MARLYCRRFNVGAFVLSDAGLNLIAERAPGRACVCGRDIRQGGARASLVLFSQAAATSNITKRWQQLPIRQLEGETA